MTASLCKNDYRLFLGKFLYCHRLSSFASVSRVAVIPLLATSDQHKPDIDNRDGFFSDVEKVYRILRQFHSRLPKLDLALRQSGVEFRPGLVSRVFNRCGDAGNLAYNFFLWARNSHPGYSPTLEDYKAMVRVLGKMRQFGAVWGLIEEMHRGQGDFFVTSEVFVLLMRRFAASRMVDKAIELLDEMPKYGCEPDEHVFGCLLDALCKNGKVKEAAKLFEDMRMRFPPKLKYFTSLLNGWCRDGRLLEAKHVLVQMKLAGFEPDIVVYNTLLSGYATVGKMADAYALLKEMKKIQRDPDTSSYTILIQALCKKKKMDEAMNLFVEMERHGCDADVVTYTTMISGFCKHEKIGRGYQMLEEMNQKGHMPNQLTYMQIMLAHERKEQLEECVELMARMLECGCTPDLNIYNVVIRLACKLGDVHLALKQWNELEANGSSPGLDSFLVLIHGLIAQGYMIESCEYFKDMINRGLWNSPQYGTLKELLNALLRDDKLELAKNVWDFMVIKGCELDANAWTIWIHSLFSKQHVKEACSYCLAMMDADMMPQPDTFAKLMKGLKKIFNRQYAVEITEKGRKMAADRNITFKMYKRRGERALEDVIRRQRATKKRARKKKRSSFQKRDRF